MDSNKPIVGIVMGSDSDWPLVKKACEITRDALNYCETLIKPGISTKELDSIAMGIIKENKAIPTFLGYHGFPGCICASINDEIVHGIPSENTILKEGDIIAVDPQAEEATA